MNRAMSLPLTLGLLVAACESPADPHNSNEDDLPPTPDDTDAVDDTDVDVDEDDTGLVDDTDEALDDDPLRTLTVDATSTTDWVYVDLEAGAVLTLDRAAAATSTDWHLALRRFNIRTNGGDTGPGSVVVSLVDEPEGLYDGDGLPIDSALLALDAEEEADRLFDPLPEAPRGKSEVADRIDNAFGDHWYDYDAMSGVASANDTVGWIVRGADGLTYARVRMTALDFPTRAGNGIESYAVQIEVQADGESGFGAPVTWAGSIGASGGLDCWSFVSAEDVPCTGTGWDLQLGFLGRSFFLRTHSGDAGEGAGGAYGPVDWSTIEAFSDAQTHPADGDISGDFVDDVSRSLLQREPWYAYGVGGPHTLAPNFRTYVIDPDPLDASTPRFALQVADYYLGGGSGNVGLQWVVLDDTP